MSYLSVGAVNCDGLLLLHMTFLILHVIDLFCRHCIRWFWKILHLCWIESTTQGGSKITRNRCCLLRKSPSRYTTGCPVVYLVVRLHIRSIAGHRSNHCCHQHGSILRKLRCGRGHPSTPTAPLLPPEFGCTHHCHDSKGQDTDNYYSEVN